MLARGSAAGKGEVMVGEDGSIKAVPMRHPASHVQSRYGLSPPQSPTVDSASFYSSK